MRCKFIAAAAAIVGFVTAGAQAGTVDPSQYTLTAISGSWARGMTNWNDAYTTPYIDNGAELAYVEGLMSDGYSYSPGQTGTHNGIYTWPDAAGYLEFAFAGGADHSLDTLSFVTSRVWSVDRIAVETRLDGGAWQTAGTMSSGFALSHTTAAANTLDLGGVTADAFRFRVTGSNVSVHEISIDGASLAAAAGPAATPLPAAVWGGLALFGMVGGKGLLARRRKPTAAA